MTVKIVQEVDLDKVSIVVNQQNQIATAAVEDITSLFRDGIDGFMPQAEDCYYRDADGAIFSGKKISQFYKSTYNGARLWGNLAVSGKVSNATYVEDGQRKLKFDLAVKFVGNEAIRQILKFDDEPHKDEQKVKDIQDYLLGLANGSYKELSTDAFTLPRYLVVNSFGRDAVSLDDEPEITFISADVVNTEEEFSVEQHYTVSVVVTKELDSAQMNASVRNNNDVYSGMIYYRMLTSSFSALSAFCQYKPQYDYYNSSEVEHPPILGAPAKEGISTTYQIALGFNLAEWTE